MKEENEELRGEIPLTTIQDLESYFRSEQDRSINVEKAKLKGNARELYLSKKVKLSNAQKLVDSAIGIGLTKVKPDKEKKGKRKNSKGRRSENEG